ncbi:triose-phosphate isomerase [Devosia sp. CN2-171]|uniref:triose-phosphate isomerase n=1 Tax=Devosia sp. CN2-171 TaxID=3400909 RepID=UPI003BF7CDFA
MASITPLIAGNWKMNGTSLALGEVRNLAAKLAESAPRCTVVICPPATLLERLSEIAAPAGIVTGGQDCHSAASGAHTGDVSAQMLVDAGAQYVIVGHSERRTNHGETDETVRAKSVAALSAGLIPIICVGETESERDAGKAEAVVLTQLQGSIPAEWPGHGIVIAYEPVWAIGTGRTPTSADIAQMHDTIRRDLESRFGERGAATAILYGGSMKPSNAAEILRISNVNGGLVGGASLLANDFHAIISAV